MPEFSSLHCIEDVWQKLLAQAAWRKRRRLCEGLIHGCGNMMWWVDAYGAARLSRSVSLSPSLSPLPLCSAFKPCCSTESFIMLPRGTPSSLWTRPLLCFPSTVKSLTRKSFFHPHQRPPSLIGGPPGQNSTRPLIKQLPLIHPTATSLVHPCGSSGVGVGLGDDHLSPRGNTFTTRKPFKQILGCRKHLLCVHLGASMHKKRPAGKN